jgi:hypothetical protein
MQAKGVQGDPQGESEVLAKKFPIGTSRMLLSVPFVGRDTPSKAAEFASADIAIGLTVLSFRYSGTLKLTGRVKKRDNHKI